MATKTKGGKINLYLESGSTYSIVDDSKRVYTIEEAQEAFNAGRVEDYNMALGRLRQLNWDIEALKKYFREMDALRRPSR